MDDGVICVIATSLEAGTSYAQELGLVDYRVCTDPAKTEGLRTRAIVVTPGYIEQIQRAQWKAREVFDIALRNGLRSGINLG